MGRWLWFDLISDGKFDGVHRHESMIMSVSVTSLRE